MTDFWLHRLQRPCHLWDEVLRSVDAAVSVLRAHLMSEFRLVQWAEISAGGLDSDHWFTDTQCIRSFEPACSEGVWPFVGLSAVGILFRQRHGVHRCSDARCPQPHLPSMTKCARFTPGDSFLLQCVLATWPSALTPLSPAMHTLPRPTICGAPLQPSQPAAVL